MLVRLRCFIASAAPIVRWRSHGCFLQLFLFRLPRLLPGFPRIPTQRFLPLPLPLPTSHAISHPSVL